MKQQFKQLIMNNHQRIRFIASRYANQHDAEDIYQEILLQLWRSFASFKEASSEKTWVYRVALNTAISFVRKTVANRKLHKTLDGLFCVENEPAQNNCQDEILSQFIQSLSDTDAAVLMMYLDGLPNNEISEVIGVSVDAINKRISRIKQLFKQQYIED